MQDWPGCCWSRQTCSCESEFKSSLCLALQDVHAKSKTTNYVLKHEVVTHCTTCRFPGVDLGTWGRTFKLDLGAEARHMVHWEKAAQERTPRSQQAQPEASWVQFNSVTCAFFQSGGWDMVEPHPPPIKWIACLYFGYCLRIQARPLRQKCETVDFLNVTTKFSSKGGFLPKALFQINTFARETGSDHLQLYTGKHCVYFIPNGDKFTSVLVH